MNARKALAISSAFIGFAEPAAGQTQTADAASPNDLATQVSSEADDEILVTAQRRAERLEEVPMSVSVLTADTLAKAGINNLRDLANLTSGYQLGQGGVNPQPSIRGVTTILSGSFENNVAVYIDGLYQPLAISLNIDLPNIESIQVLKGPQGTLYGRNATGGALLLSTVNPDGTWQGKAEATFARFDDKRLGAFIAGPITRGVSVSLASYVRRSDGYVKLASRFVPGAVEGRGAPLEQDLVRTKLRLEPSSALTATIAYSYARIQDQRLNGFSPIENVAKVYATVPAGATRPTRMGVTAFDPRSTLETRQHEVGLTVDFETAVGKLKSVTGYTRAKGYNPLDFDGSYAPLSFTVNRQRERTFQQSVDFAVDFGPRFDFLIGGTYLHDKLGQALGQFRGRNTAVSGQTPLIMADLVELSNNTFRQRKEAFGLFAEGALHVTDVLTVTLGGRYNREKQHVFLQSKSSTPASVRPPTNADATFQRFTPRVSVRYEFANRSNIYATYSEGFRSGAFNTMLPACAVATPECYFPAKEETIKAYEVGLKTAQSGYRFELAGFHYDYRNLQVSTTQIFLDRPLLTVTNAPRATIYGVEGNFEVEPVDNLSVRASATWLHARYGKNFILNGVGVANAGPGGGIGLAPNDDPLKTYLNITQDQDLSGLQMARAPDFTGNIGAEYLVPNSEGGLRLSANLRYTSSYVLTNPSVWGNNPGVPIARQREQRFREGNFALLSVSATYTDPSGHYYVRIWGNNLTDHRYRLHYAGTSTFGTYAPLAEPLTVGGTIGLRY